jgi:predicted nucleic acid-binding protein
VIVADTNLIAYLLIPGQWTETAEAILRRDPAWAAPLLWRSELRSVLTLAKRRYDLDLRQVLSIMEEAERLMKGNEFQVNSAEVLRLAGACRCSSYDCEFVVLAQHLGVPLVTSDRAILAAFPGIAVSLEAFGPDPPV